MREFCGGLPDDGGLPDKKIAHGDYIKSVNRPPAFRIKNYDQKIVQKH